MKNYWSRNFPGRNKTEKIINLSIVMFIGYCMGHMIGLMIEYVVR